METTLELRWFVAGMPSVVVQRWFKLECPGELLEDEPDREDLYAEQNLPSDRLKACLFRTVDPEAVNLKLRQGNLELKLRQQELGIYQFGQIDDSAIWSGKIEQWCKYSQQDLQDSNLLTADLVNQTSWLSVHKRREQKTYRNVKIELTDLKVKSDRWWSIAFEMALDSKNQLSEQHLREVVEQAARSYQGAKLLSHNSYSYSSWQNQFTTLD
ncbi:MAG TPA: hypothetical protein V6C71_26645 [Coleofasciculaceae cyanobacterium]|jgi:hypothetical protein